MHGDLRFDNILWNEELQRVLIIDFHCLQLNFELKRREVRSKKRSSGDAASEPRKSIRLAF